jgi:hypothetical protein
MMKKAVKKVTAEEVAAMSPPEILSLTPSQIPEGYDVEHENGANARLVPFGAAKGGIKFTDADWAPFDAVTAPSMAAPTCVAGVVIPDPASPIPGTIQSRPDTEDKDTNTGILFLRFFNEDENNGKILTRLKGKVYFPKDSTIKPGWYVACVVEEAYRHGIMDTIPLSEINVGLLNSRYIKGIHVKRNYKTNQLEIYPSIPREKLEKEQPTCIFRVNLPEEEAGDRPSTTSISDLLLQKQQELLKARK